MALSNDLILQFVKATQDKPATIKESIVYGTVQDDGLSVLIDGSSTPRQIPTTVVLTKGDRVTVMIKDHEAIVTGNATSKAAIEKDTLKVADLDAQNARIDNLDAAVVNVQNTLTAYYDT